MEILPIVRPTFPPLSTIGEKLDECLRTGQVTNGGQHVLAFEEALTRHLTIPTICFSSGQAALIAMLRATMKGDLRAGEIICPSFTFCATPHAVVSAGMRPVFADVGDDMRFDLDDVERKITGRTQAILAVAPYGILPDYEALERLGARYGLHVLSDNAAAFGSTSEVPQISRGLAQIFSFHATKPFSTMEGGALSSFDPYVIEKAKAIRNFGQVDGDVWYVGHNGKMTEVAALLGLEQLKTWPSRAWHRMKHAAELTEALEEIPGLVIPEASANQEPIWLYHPVLITDEFGLPTNDVIRQLAGLGIMARRYYAPPCHRMACYLDPRTSLLVTERISSQVIALPVYNDMRAKEIARIANALRLIQRGEFR